jgi:hypothetical protein
LLVQASTERGGQTVVISTPSLSDGEAVISGKTTVGEGTSRHDIDLHDLDTFGRTSDESGREIDGGIVMSKQQTHSLEAVAWLNPMLARKGQQSCDCQDHVPPRQKDAPQTPAVSGQLDSTSIGNTESEDITQDTGDSGNKGSLPVTRKFRDRFSRAW